MISLNPAGVASVWLRHAQVYRRTWLFNALPPMVEPLLYLVGFGYGLDRSVGSVVHQGQTVGYRAYIAPAMVALGVLFQAFFEAAYGSFIRLRFQRTWNGLLTAPLDYTDIFVGDWLWAATRGLIAGFVTAGVTVALGMASFASVVASIPLIVLGSLMFASVGMAVAGAVKTVDQINVPVFLFILPMFTLCGTFFPRENLPGWIQAFAGLLPLSPLVDLMRWPLAGLPPGWPFKVAILLAWAVGFYVLGWRLIRRHVFR